MRSDRSCRIQRVLLTVKFMLIPAHIEVEGNEAADKLAKDATKINRIEATVLYSKNEDQVTIKSKIRQNGISGGNRSEQGSGFTEFREKLVERGVS